MSEYVGTLEGACELIADCPHTTAQDEGMGYPLVRTPNIGCGRLVYEKMHRVCEQVYNERNRRAKPVAGDLIYAREAPAGNVALITKGEYVCLGQRTVLIRPKSDVVDSVYLTYYLLEPSQRNRLLSTASGATVTHVNLPAIRGLQVSLPPLPVQRKIAEILGAYDDLIENNRKRIALLEKMARELYRERFVRRPKNDGKMAMEQIAKFVRGKVIVKDATVPGEVPVVAGGMEPAYYHNASNTDAPVITVSGSGANAGYVRMYFEKIWASDCSWVDAGSTQYIRYVYCFLKDNDAELRNAQKGAAQPHVHAKDVNSLMVSTDIAALSEFDGLVKPMFEEIASLTFQSRNLARQRDRLLPRLMSGKIDVGALVGENA